MSWMSSIGAVGGILPGVGQPLGAALQGWQALALQQQVEPEIPSALDDWDTEFERLTGSLPEFSRLQRQREVLQVALRARARYDLQIVQRQQRYSYGSTKGFR